MSGRKDGAEGERDMLLLVRGARQVVRVAGAGEKVKLGTSMGDLAIISATQYDGVSIAVRQ